jgi:LysR family nitrogen assimilation transcriptional regulator
VDLRQLHYFVAVADLESVTLAASRLHVAQSALSRQIKMLEQELRTTLLERSGRGIRLTASGARLHLRAKHLLDEADELRDAIVSEGKATAGVLRIGANPSFGDTLFPGLAERCARELPNVRLHLRTDLTAHIQDALLRGEAELGVIAFPDRDAHMILTPLVQEKIYLVSAPGNDPGFGAECTARQVSKLPLLLPGLPNRERLGYERLAASKGFSLDCRLEADSLSVLKDLARRKLGHLLLPAVAFAGEASSERWIMSQVRGFVLQRYVVSMANRPLSAAATSIVSLLHDEAHELQRRGIV